MATILEGYMTITECASELGVDKRTLVDGI